jgi:hypothetical protein
MPWLLAVLTVQAGARDTMSRVRATAQARVARAQAIARDAELVKAVLASNGRIESLADVQKKDGLWMSSRNYPLRKQLMAASCSSRLRKLVGDDPLVVEAFAMDARGALVCLTAETSDYWQGDEAKWQRTFQQGRESFVDEPAFDVSSGVYAVQLSVPMSGPTGRIGALTLTLKLRRTQLGASKD